MCAVRTSVREPSRAAASSAHRERAPRVAAGLAYDGWWSALCRALTGGASQAGPAAVRRGQPHVWRNACRRSSTESCASARAGSRRSSPTSPTRSTRWRTASPPSATPSCGRRPTGSRRGWRTARPSTTSCRRPSRRSGRRRQYEADVTYGTNNEFGFDYLRDNMAWRPEELVQRGHSYAIVDEVDSILIDEARTPLIISGPASGDANKWYAEFAKVVLRMNAEVDYEVDEKKRTVGVLEPGIAKVEDYLGIENLYESLNTPLIGFLNLSLIHI